MKLKKIFPYLVILIVIGTGLFFFSSKRAMETIPKTTISPTISPETSILVDVAVWYPSAPWTEPKKDTQQTSYGNLDGESIKATVTSDEAFLPHFEMINELKEKGFLSDMNLAADGPGGSSWGYKKERNNQSQILIFSYQTTPTSENPNEPVQFNCPCQIDLTAFISKPF